MVTFPNTEPAQATVTPRPIILAVTELVASFISAAERQLSVVGRDLGVPPDGVLGELLAGVHQQRRPRRGLTESCVLYSVHGIGCLFIGRRDRSEIDLDLAPDGRPMFDSWRIKRWARSVGLPLADEEAITAEAAALVERGMLTAVDDWRWSWSFGRHPGG